MKSLGGAANPGMSECMKRRWISLDKETKLIRRLIEPSTVKVRSPPQTSNSIPPAPAPSPAPSPAPPSQNPVVYLRNWCPWNCGRIFSGNSQPRESKERDSGAQTGSSAGGGGETSRNGNNHDSCQHPKDEVREQLLKVQKGESLDVKVLKILKKRKMTGTKKETWYEVSKGKEFTVERKAKHSLFFPFLILKTIRLKFWWPTGFFGSPPDMICRNHITLILLTAIFLLYYYGPQPQGSGYRLNPGAYEGRCVEESRI
eukprot:1338528-Amorphochlora_amoeboformis.AAC.1